MTEHHHLDLLDGVHVYPGKGGEFCDLTFSGMPEHVAGLIGAKTNPYPKREKAIRSLSC